MTSPRVLNTLLIAVLTAALALAALPGMSLVGTVLAQESEQRTVQLQDIMDWKRIGGARLSADGSWFAYRLAPAEGNGEIIVRSTQNETEYRFPAGSGGAGFGGGGLEISDDSHWVGFAIYPEFSQDRPDNNGPPQRNKLGLLDLTTGELTEIEEVRGFAFSGENAEWIAMQKYAAGGTGGRATGAGPGGGRGRPGGSRAGGNNNNDRSRGADLILQQLATGTQMNIGNVAEFEFDESGSRLAWLVDTESNASNGVQIRLMDSGVVIPLESSTASYQSLNWTDEGDGLTTLKGIDDEDYEDPLYSVVAFTDMTAQIPTKVVYDPLEDISFPQGMTIAANRAPSFTDDLSSLVFGIVEAEMTEKAEQRMEQGDDEPDEGGRGAEASDGDGDESESEKPDLVIWHWRDDRLQSMQQVQENRDQNFNYLAVYHISADRFVRLGDDDVRNVTMAPKGKYAIANDNSRYSLMGNLNGQRFQDIHVINVDTGDRTMALEQVRWYNGISPDGTHLLYYEDGDY